MVFIYNSDKDERQLKKWDELKLPIFKSLGSMYLPKETDLLISWGLFHSETATSGPREEVTAGN